MVWAKRTLMTGDSISDETLGPLELSQKPNGSAHLANKSSAPDQPLDINSKRTDISNKKPKNINKEKNGNKKSSVHKTISCTKNSCKLKVYKPAKNYLI